MEEPRHGRMSVAQIAQRIRHHAPTTDGPLAVHDFVLVKQLLTEECQDILARLGTRDAGWTRATARP